MTDPIRAGAEAPEPTPAIPRLQAANFPGFLSAARRNPDLILNSRGNISFQFGCGRTHGFAVCGDDDYVSQVGPGCNLINEWAPTVDPTQGQVDLFLAGVTATTMQITLDDVNATGLGLLMENFYNGGTPIPGTMFFVDIDIPTFGPCTIVIAEWTLSALVENVAGQSYFFDVDVTLPFGNDQPPLCDEWLDQITASRTCINNAQIAGALTISNTTGVDLVEVRTGLLVGDPDGVLKCNTDNQGLIAFRPRQFYALRECGDWFDEVNWVNEVEEDLLQAANVELAQLLEFDQGRGQNPSLISTAQNLTPGAGVGVPGTPVSIVRGFDLLLGAFATVGNGLGTFHGSSKIVPYATHQRQVFLDGNVYRGPLRLPFNPGPGFINAVPVVAGGDPFGTIVEDDDIAWLYGVQSPVEFRIGATETFDMREYRTNYRGALGEHKAVVRFNTCHVFAVRVCTNDVTGITV